VSQSPAYLAILEEIKEDLPWLIQVWLRYRLAKNDPGVLKLIEDEFILIEEKPLPFWDLDDEDYRKPN